MDELEAAWDELHEANAALGWLIGRPAYEPRRAVPWSLWAADMSEKPKLGHRGREWTATALTEAGVVREMARCLRKISGGTGAEGVPVPGQRPRPTRLRR